VVYVVGVDVYVLYMLGYLLGLVCLYVLVLGMVFIGDMFFVGGLGVIGCSFSDWLMIFYLICEWLFILLFDIVVCFGYGEFIIIVVEVVIFFDV